MDNLENNISLTKEIIEKRLNGNNLLQYYIHPFTINNINKMLSNFDIQNKDILTITSSGDYVINALLKNPKSITTFDINPITFYYLNLKLAGIKTLDKHNFLKYFYGNDDYPYEKHSRFIYHNQIRNNLDEESKNYWDFIYNTYYQKNYHDHYISCIPVIGPCYSYETASNCNTYLQKDNYENLKNHLNENKLNINFINANLFDVTKNNNSYDLIILPNIYNYLNITANEYKNFITNNIPNILNKDGEVIALYIYDYLKKNKLNKFNKKDIINTFDESFYSYDFPSFYSFNYNKNKKDKILVYKKEN